MQDQFEVISDLYLIPLQYTNVIYNYLNFNLLLTYEHMHA
jgi:hypothetical protein